MTHIWSVIRRRFAVTRARRLLSHEAGIAAVEFSLILPILVLLWLGGIEVTAALSIDRRLNNLGASMGDLVARTKQVTYADITDIFGLGTSAMFPYSANGLAMRITAVDMNNAGTATVAWTRKQGTLPSGTANYAKSDPMNSVIPSQLRVPNSQIIMSEVFQTYTPTVGYVITGGIRLKDRMFFVPRLVTYVALCEDSADTTCDS